MWPGQKRARLRSAPFPSGWQNIIESRCSFYRRLPESDRKELAGHIQIFLAEKRFEGCGGLSLTEEMPVIIAANACLLQLRRQTGCYPDLKTILIYPTVYAAPTVRHIGSGIMEEGQQIRAGESWREGAVVLAWDAVQQAMHNPGDGLNVIWHEFAHQLDFEDGHADGVPVLGRGQSSAERRSLYKEWSRVMRREYEDLRIQSQRGEETVLRSYGATNPAEFFAVATECFFGKPEALKARHPELYEELKWYYQQDPAKWLSPAPSSD